MIAMIAATLTLAGGSAAEPRTPARPRGACTPEAPRERPLRVWAEPEAGQAPLIEAITEARVSIRVMVYELGRGAILDAILRKAKAGVEVRVILDGSKREANGDSFADLRAARVKVHWSDPRFSYMHAKTLVVDDAVAVISTGNFVAPRVGGTRDFAARDEDPEDVRTLAALFDADWRKAPPDLSCTRLVVSPENSRARLLAFIGSARRTLDIESMELSDGAVRRAIAARRRAGVKVRIVLADPRWISANLDAASFLAESGIRARYLVSPAIHTKVITVDGERAYLGSVNLSRTSLEQNREVGLSAYEPEVVALMHETFERDWASARAF
jgi:phosphatidylserine/phosphatidylglycerophosphate/cardiolipin synthase-like enzyme